MLVLNRKTRETVDVTLEDGRRIEITILEVVGNKVSLGIDAPRSILIDRAEVTRRKSAEELVGSHV